MLIILVALPSGLLLTFAAGYPVIWLLGAPPALVLAIVGLVRPSFYRPIGFTDPRRALRRYLHVFAAISVVPAGLSLLGVLESIWRR
ncbi:MAG TPA: hypothetical protein VHJ20_14500 [Polyangia bacterium]|nr:hypothetical protein [Polyangia bacterium]